MIDHAERTEGVAVITMDGYPGVEGNLRRVGYQGVGRESLVLAGILDDEEPIALDCVGTERNTARRFGYIQAKTTLEPLSVAIYQRYQRYGRAGQS